MLSTSTLTTSRVVGNIGVLEAGHPRGRALLVSLGQGTIGVHGAGYHIGVFWAGHNWCPPDLLTSEPRIV